MNGALVARGRERRGA